MASPHCSGHQEHHLGHIMSEKNYSSEPNTQSVHSHAHVCARVCTCLCICVCTWGPRTEQLWRFPLQLLEHSVKLFKDPHHPGPGLPRTDPPWDCSMVGTRLFGATCSWLCAGLGTGCSELQGVPEEAIFPSLASFQHIL